MGKKKAKALYDVPGQFIEGDGEFFSGGERRLKVKLPSGKVVDGIFGLTFKPFK